MNRRHPQKSVYSAYGPVNLSKNSGVPTPHLVAAAAGSLKSLRVLQEHNPIDLNANESALFRIAALNGNVNIVKFLLEESVATSDPHAFTDPPQSSHLPQSILDPGSCLALCFASYHGQVKVVKASSVGHAEVVKLLLDHYLAAAPLGIPCLNPSTFNSKALRDPHRNSNNIIKMLLDHSFTAARLGIPCVDPSACNSKVLLSASRRGNVDAVKLLLDHSFAAAPLGLPHANPSVNDSRALRKAFESGHIEVVKLLLDHRRKAKPLGVPCVDPAARHKKALRIARENGHRDIVRLLEEYEIEQ
ncbi:hypothetical protein HDU96_002476 [Phlyctochytrium bullatum]|nr:hypothetical protein HDU96_002476 [Phlyctochytrium bullatum]